jgi:hypothetical protein
MAMHPWTLEQLARSRQDDLVRQSRFAALLADARLQEVRSPIWGRWASRWMQHRNGHRPAAGGERARPAELSCCAES